MDDTIPKYVLVENYIRQAIKTGEFSERLPGERTIAKTVGVSYMTARKAIGNLVDRGILYKIPTKGVFVNANRNNKNFRTIGYFLDSSIISGISSPYYSLIFNALEKVASANDYSLVYFSDANTASFRKTLMKVDGVIASCLPRIEETIQLIKEIVPIVVIDNSSVDKSIPSVIVDNFNADVRCVDYIASLGHRRIGFMTGLEDSDVGKNRYAGYLHGLRKHDIPFDESLVFKGNYSFESGQKGAQYYLSLGAPPSAIICANDSMALGAMKVLDKRGVKVPDDISIVGFDDIEIASQITPALTTIAAPIEEIAQHAFSALLKLIQGKQPEQQHIALNAELVIRETCAKLAQPAVAKPGNCGGIPKTGEIRSGQGADLDSE